jgi:outer membrane protein assembly factor BamB
VAGAADDQEKATYASPVVLDLQGTRAALFMGPTALSAVETSTGKLLWSKPHWGSEVTSDPVVSGNLVLMSYATPTLFQINKSDARVLWSGPEFGRAGLDALTTPILLNGYVYLVEWDQPMATWNWTGVKRRPWPLLCVELKTGKVAWRESLPYVQLTAVDGRLLMLDLEGRLSVVEATPTAFRSISSADVLAGADRPRLFTTPAVPYGSRVYCRNFAGDVVCIDMR